MSSPTYRKTTQHLAPVRWTPPPAGSYDIHPAFPLEGEIRTGFTSLAEIVAHLPMVVVDGHGGTLWYDFRERLDAALRERGARPAWVDAAEAYRPQGEIGELAAPFLGGEDPLFGKRFPGTLSDFVDTEKLRSMVVPSDGQPVILYGCGAALAGWEAPLMYLEVPKNEIQFRSRAGSVANLGLRRSLPPKEAYKRFYFVDWPVLAKHRTEILPRVDWVVDLQRAEEPVFAAGADVRAALAAMSRSVFRPRPWFEPGPWGGQWMKKRFSGLASDVPNYAWSFEAILPENGLMLAKDGILLEISFDCLMALHHQEVLGEHANVFGRDFPIRFDYLDTFGGGNLSLQCHPRPDYIRDQFGEPFTQDETYYIFDAGADAVVWLGFEEGVKPEEFRAAVETSHREKTPLDAQAWVKQHPARPGDLFLIPHGTIHCSGSDTLVLEISATPYIFTFKLYDWMRLGLDGQPRPLNIERAMENLDFTRQGEQVERELISRPRVMAEGDGWKREHLPTHPDHFYDVHRITFSSAVEIETAGSPHMLNVTSGKAVRVQAGEESARRFNFAETFIVPSAAVRYRLSAVDGPAQVVMAFLKPR